MVTGHLYLGGYIGDMEAEGRWLADKITGWAESVETLSGVSRKHPQSAYARLQKSLQQEWAFMQRVTPGIGNAFVPVETAYRREGSRTCQSNRRDWPFQKQHRRPLRTRRRPVSSQYTLLQHSGARWSSRQQTTRPTSGRVRQRFGDEANSR